MLRKVYCVAVDNSTKYINTVGYTFAVASILDDAFLIAKAYSKELSQASEIKWTYIENIMLDGAYKGEYTIVPLGTPCAVWVYPVILDDNPVS